MSSSTVNKVILIGNIGEAIEVNYTRGGTAVTTFSVATNETWKDKNTGDKQQSTEWHRVVAWGKLAEIVAEHLGKGSKVYVEGGLKTRKWQDQQGIDRWTTEVVADEVKFLDGKAQE